MNYENLQHVKQEFLAHNFDMPETFSVCECPYQVYQSTTRPFYDIISNGYKVAVAYKIQDKNDEQSDGQEDHFSTDLQAEQDVKESDEENKQPDDQLGMDELDQMLVFVWVLEGYSLVPGDVISIPADTFAQMLYEASDEDKKIGTTVGVQFVDLPSSNVIEVKGKVDTGAGMSSLHADDWKVDSSQQKVKFKAPSLSDNWITMIYDEMQAIRTAGDGVEYRPVVKFTIKINGQTIEDAKFNLNDRSEMDSPILIGENILKDGDFVIDPSKEGVTTNENAWEVIDQQAQLVKQPAQIDETYTYNKEQAEKIYNTLVESDISMSDLIKYIQSQLLDKFDDVHY